MLASLGDVSEMTGGRASIGEDIGRALSRLNETTRFEYLLGYYPKDDKWDGQYRQIQVKVNRPGVKVSFRHGYYARDTLRPYDREEFMAYSRVSAAGGYESDLSDVPFRLAAANDAANARINIDLVIDPEKVGFRMVDDRHLARLYIVTFYADAQGNLLGELWKTMNLDLPEESYQRMLRSGIPFSTAIPVKAPNQMLKVIVYDTWSDKVGSSRIRVK